jgi:hypothetical protein
MMMMKKMKRYLVSLLGVAANSGLLRPALMHERKVGRARNFSRALKTIKHVCCWDFSMNNSVRKCNPISNYINERIPLRKKREKKPLDRMNK